jgi:purine-cytosine permease-like protein
MQAVRIGPVPAGERMQSSFGLFLIFAGGLLVATTLQVGATLAPAFRRRNALVLIALGSVAGAFLIAAPSPVSPSLLRKLKNP